MRTLPDPETDCAIQGISTSGVRLDIDIVDVWCGVVY